MFGLTAFLLLTFVYPIVAAVCVARYENGYWGVAPDVD